MHDGIPIMHHYFFQSSFEGLGTSQGQSGLISISPYAIYRPELGSSGC